MHQFHNLGESDLYFVQFSVQILYPLTTNLSKYLSKTFTHRRPDPCPGSVELIYFSGYPRFLRVVDQEAVAAEFEGGGEAGEVGMIGVQAT